MSAKKRKVQKDFHEGPRRTAKGHEGVGGGSRGVLPRVGKGRKDFHQAGPRRTGKGKKIIHEGPRRTAKGHEGVGGGSRGVRQRKREGPRKGSPGNEKKISTKGHEERRRATKALAGAQEGPAKGRSRSKSSPRRAGRNSKGLEKNSKGIREGTRRKTLRGPGRTGRITAYFTNRFHSSLP